MTRNNLQTTLFYFAQADRVTNKTILINDYSVIDEERRLFYVGTYSPHTPSPLQMCPDFISSFLVEVAVMNFDFNESDF
jgi:hypothetical protein